MGHELPGVESDRTRSDLETLFTDRQLEGEPERVAADVARALGTTGQI